jgi:hypothetical protein
LSKEIRIKLIMSTILTILTIQRKIILQKNKKLLIKKQRQKLNKILIKSQIIVNKVYSLIIKDKE